ncbi:MAG: hypothetical protein HGA78_03725 [Nitrospirales bacterium]|nr:hypothetical protein [Nitrospirales bacterium]
MSTIQNIRTEQPPPTGVRVNTSELSSQQAKAVTVASGPIRQEYVVNLNGNGLDLGQIQDRKAELHQAAKEIRTAGNTMQQIDDYLDRMKESLNGIVKTFPPYPPGSEERVNLLRSYNSFRKLIDELSFGLTDRVQEMIASETSVTPEQSEVTAVSVAGNEIEGSGTEAPAS